MARQISAGRRVPGRPRSAAIDRLILRAALELFVEQGIHGASIERIARRAGVAKTTIYRRWSGRDALLVQAIEVARNESAAGYSVEAVDAASPREFVKLLVGACEIAARPEIRRLVARLIGSMPDHPRLIELYRDTYYLPRRDALIRALRRVQDAGLLRQGADVETVADMVVGALVYRLLFASPEQGLDQQRATMLRLLYQAGFNLSDLGS
jgi:AcrR family transcriptional regulator